MNIYAKHERSEVRALARGMLQHSFFEEKFSMIKDYGH
jgi:hypothetical protein